MDDRRGGAGGDHGPDGRPVQGLTLRRYALHTDKLSAPVRLLLLTDLHSTFYGRRSGGCSPPSRPRRPTPSSWRGIRADDSRGDAGVDALMSALGGACPCCYVSGNHEVRTGCLEALKRRFRSWGSPCWRAAALCWRRRGAHSGSAGWTTPPPLPASRGAGAVPGLPGADGGQPVHSAALPPAGADGMLPGQWIRSGGVGHAHGGRSACRG